MTAEEVETIAKALYELDRQKGLRSQRWHVGSEMKRDKYRLRAHTLLASEGFARVIARLENRYRRTGQAETRAGEGSNEASSPVNHHQAILA